jgi:hypothetical protein
MRRFLMAAAALIVLPVAAGPTQGHAQGPPPGGFTETRVVPARTEPIHLPTATSVDQAYAATYLAPGNYGMAWGSASYKVPRSYSAFSSPYGGGYGLGYAPTTVSANPFGAGLWRPTPEDRGHQFNAGGYRTFPVPPNAIRPLPPVGAYAPSLGPAPVGWPR